MPTPYQEPKTLEAALVELRRMRQEIANLRKLMSEPIAIVNKGWLGNNLAWKTRDRWENLKPRTILYAAHADMLPADLPA